VTLKSSRDSTDHDNIKEFYNKTYYGRSVKVSRMPWHMRVIASRLGDLTNLRVIDVACGKGEWLLELAARGASVAGVDISEKAIEVASSLLPSGSLKVGVAESLPFADGQFDLVTCLGALEHFLDQKKALSEMTRIAKRDARFLLLVPNSGFLTRRLGLYKGTEQAEVRETVYSIAEWRNLIIDSGLSVDVVWRDLHPLSREWIVQGPVWRWPLRSAQAMALALWPTAWQYQIYFLCRRNN
jgi:SAM-dependent methyltransferase